MTGTRTAPDTTAIVIGGGIIGLSIAFGLQRAGIAVRLIDPEGSPRGASWGNAGHIAVEQAEPIASPRMVKGAPGRLYPRGPLALPVAQIAAWAPFLVRLLRASTQRRFAAGKQVLGGLMAEAMPAWRRLATDAGAGALLREEGHFVVWESEATARAGRAAWGAADTGPARIRDATVAELARLRGLVATPIAGAIRFAGSGQIADTGLLAERLSARFGELSGTRILAPVERLVAADGRVAALVDGARLEADHVIVAAGIGSAALFRDLGARVPLIAERGYHIQSAAPGWPEDLPPVVFEDRSVIATRFRRGLRLAGFVEFARADAPPDPAKWRVLRRHAARLGLPIAADGGQWMGARPTLPDYLPAIGRSEGHTNLLYAFGHNHLGLTLAALTAEMIRDAVAGGGPLPAALSLARFGLHGRAHRAT